MVMEIGLMMTLHVKMVMVVEGYKEGNSGQYCGLNG